MRAKTASVPVPIFTSAPSNPPPRGAGESPIETNETRNTPPPPPPCPPPPTHPGAFFSPRRPPPPPPPKTPPRPTPPPSPSPANRLCARQFHPSAAANSLPAAIHPSQPVQFSPPLAHTTTSP